MYVCELCGSVFSDPERVKYCYEDYNGVSSMFPNSNYGYYDVCPYCGSEEIDNYFEEEDDEDTIYLGTDDTPDTEDKTRNTGQ